MAPTHIDDVGINLTASNLGKLKQLEAVDYADLIVSGKQMAVSALNDVLVAVEVRIGGVIEMRVDEAARHREGGDRSDRLYRVENRRVREPGNISDRAELTTEMKAGQPSTQPSGAATAGETQTWVAAIADGEGTVGQVAEGVAQRRLAGPPARNGFQASGMHLFRFIRTAVECSAAEILKK